MDLKEIGINTRNWVDSPQDRDYWRALVNAALIFRVHKLWSLLVISVKFGLGLEWDSPILVVID
jgi:hypothetical protein